MRKFAIMIGLSFLLSLTVTGSSNAQFSPAFRILTTSDTDKNLADFGVCHPTLGCVVVYSILNCYPGQDGLVEGPPGATGSDDDCVSVLCGVNFSQRNNTVMFAPGFINPTSVFLNGYQFTDRGSYSYNGLDTTIPNPPAACLPLGSDLVTFMATQPFGLNASVEPCIKAGSENPALTNCRTGLIQPDAQCFDPTGTEPYFPFGSISFTLTDFIGGVSTLRTVGTSIVGTEGIFPTAGVDTLYLDDCTVNDKVCQGDPAIPCTSDPDCGGSGPCEWLNTGLIDGSHGGNVARNGLRVDLRKVIWKPDFDIPQNLLAGVTVPIGSMGHVNNQHPCSDPTCPEKLLDPPAGEPILNFAPNQIIPPSALNPAKNIEGYIRNVVEPAVLLHAAEEGTTATSYTLQFGAVVLPSDAPIILPLATSSNVLIIWTDDPVPQDPNSDNDTIADSYDNCILSDNQDQTDTDGNYIGDACECDFDGNGTCGFNDFNVFLACFGLSGLPLSGPGVCTAGVCTQGRVGLTCTVPTDCDTPLEDPTCGKSDMDGNLTVGFNDFSLFLIPFGGPPGPGGPR